jgi:Ankyrin repeat
MQNGATALILAAQMGHTDLVTQLLERGADVNATPEVSHTDFVGFRVCVCVLVCVCMRVCECVCVYVCVRVSVGVCVCMHMHMPFCVYVM